MHNFLLCGVAVFATALFGCSKGPAESAKGNAQVTANPAVNGTNAGNGNADAIPGVIGPATDGNVANQRSKLDPPLKNAGANPAPAGAPVAPASRPAPDNSTFSSQLTDVARETRTFQRHPQLLKVEKTIEPGKSSIKVFLRGGKVIDLPGDRIDSLATIPAADIMGLIGAAPTQ